jgi:hypothetical protein
MTEDQIERRVESMFNQLDSMFMREGSVMTQEQYDAAAKKIGDWADEQYRKPAALRG